MEKWTPCLIAPEFLRFDPPPDGAYASVSADGYDLTALVWSPHREPPRGAMLTLIVETPADLGDTGGLPPRFPTLEELWSAIDQLQPDGSVWSVAPFIAQDPKSQRVDPAVPFTGLQLVQTGALDGTAAARMYHILSLHSPLGGFPHGVQ